MQGAISTIEAVERWFRANEAPFFTLAYYSSSTNTGQGQVILRNQKDIELDSAWNKLRSAIMDQTGFGRAQLNLIVYAKPEAYNTPVGRTNIDLVANQMPQMAGIGSLPMVAGSGYISESDFSRRLNEERQKWEMKQEIEALRDQVQNPANDWMAGLERFAASPLGIALISKFTGTPAGTLVASPINGPAPHDDDDNLPTGDDVEAELDDLEAIAAANGMTLKAFLHKTANLAKAQPGVVAMLAQQ